MENTPLTAEEIAAQVGGKVVPVTDSSVALSFTPEEQALMDELKKGSGEEDLGGNYQFIPYITINNQMVDYEIANGGTVKARCKPEFTVTEKEGEEYRTSLFAPEFKAVVLKFMNRVQRKPIMDQQGKITNKMPYFRSLEFKSFKSDIIIRQKDMEGKMHFLKPMTYSDIKNTYGEENELWGVVYFVIINEDGTLDSQVRKGEFKGASRSVLFDYMTTKRPYSVSSVITRFSAELKTEQAQPYNCLLLTDTGRKPNDLAQILSIQKELNAMIDDNAKPSVQAEQVAPQQAIAGTVDQAQEGEVVVNEIPFV